MASNVTRDHLNLRRNLKLNDNYISNDGGDEGIKVTDAGNVGINTTVAAPPSKFEVFNSNIQYNTGTAYQSGFVFYGSGTTFTSAMVGGRLIFADGTDAGTITAFLTTTGLLVSIEQAVGGAGDLKSYAIYYPSVQIDTAADGTTLKLGLTNFDTVSGDISLSTTYGNVMMTDGTSNIFDFDMATPSLTIYDDADTDGDRDYFKIAVGAAGETDITTNDDSGGRGAHLTLDPEGIVKLEGSSTRIAAATRSASAASDFTLYMSETLNLSSGASGSDVHYGLIYSQTQTDLTGWDDVYIMYLTGGDAARSFVIRDDGKVGIGVTDPASPLEIFNTASQLKISYDASNYADISVASDGHLEIATTGTDADISIKPADSLFLYTNNYIWFQDTDTNQAYFKWNDSSTNVFRIMNVNDVSNYLNIAVGANGATTISTVDSDGVVGHLTLDIDGDIILDADGGNVTMKDAGTHELDFINSSGAWTIKNLTSDGDIIFNVNDGGVDTEVLKLDGGSGDVMIPATTKVYLDGGGDTYIYEASADDLRIIVGGDTLLNLAEYGDAGNQVHFKSSCATFLQLAETFSDDSIIGSGGTDDTHIDFRHSNKASLAVTGNITNLNLIFPGGSGNFVLLLTYDGDHTITNYKVYEFDESAADGATDVLWAGGTKPDNTASGVDILSFYYDFTPGSDKCYGVASLAFATP